MSRLEEIKSHEKEIYYLLGSERTRRYFDWLITQAERVEELEDNALNFIEYSNDKTIEVIDLKKENQRYKQALEEVFNYALSFSHIEDLDENNPELFEFAWNVSDTVEQALKGDTP